MDFVFSVFPVLFHFIYLPNDLELNRLPKLEREAGAIPLLGERVNRGGKLENDHAFQMRTFYASSPALREVAARIFKKGVRCA